jgi:hypothetical protein
MIQLAEWVFWIPDSLRYDFHHSFHNITHLTSCCGVGSAITILVGHSSLPLLLQYKTNRAVCHSNFPDFPFGKTK